MTRRSPTKANLGVFVVQIVEDADGRWDVVYDFVGP